MNILDITHSLLPFLNTLLLVILVKNSNFMRKYTTKKSKKEESWMLWRLKTKTACHAINTNTTAYWVIIAFALKIMLKHRSHHLVQTIRKILNGKSMMVLYHRRIELNFMMWLIGSAFICIFAELVILGFIGYWISTWMSKLLCQK